MCNVIIDKIEKLELKDPKTEVVVMTFNPENLNLDEANEIFVEAQKNFPEYNFIGMVKDIELSVEQIDNLIEYLEGLKDKANV